MIVVDRWWAIARSAHWTPLLAAPLLASVALLQTRAVVGPVDDRVGFVAAMGRALICLSIAFLADDHALTAAPAAPLAARQRFLARGALGMPVAALSWLGLLAVEASLTSGTPTVDPLAALALAAAALGLATARARRHPEPSPGAVGAAAAAALITAVGFVPRSWAEHAPSLSLVTAGLLALGLAGAWISTGEPRP